jgi:hypothetical protein
MIIQTALINKTFKEDKDHLNFIVLNLALKN